MRIRTSPAVATLLAVTLLAGAPWAQAVKPYGAATPQDVVSTIKQSATAGDFLAAVPVIAPAGVKDMANEAVTGIVMVLAFSNPDDPMPGSPKPSKAELDTQRKKYKDAVALATQTLKPYGLDTIVGKPIMADATQKALTATLDKSDNVALVTSIYTSMVKIAPLLGMKESPKPQGLIVLGKVTGYKIAGDKATAMNGSLAIEFVRLDGRWYIQPPGSGATPPASAAAAATPASVPPAASATPQGRTATAARSAAAPTQPLVVAGGIQIARVVVPGDDFSAKPFHADNGTRLVLWVKMPPGQGLIEIDDDASLLEQFGDDKGTNLGGKLDSFPDEFEDGTGGVIEIESSAVPAAGASALVAEGSLGMTVATGTTKTKVTNVRLQNNQKFTLGRTPITITEVETDGDSLTFTLNLPRQAMVGIRNVAFLDARGQPIEGHRTSSGYTNDAGQLGFSVKTGAKTVTLEFEAWQGQRAIKVPFKVRAGLGLN